MRSLVWLMIIAGASGVMPAPSETRDSVRSDTSIAPPTIAADSRMFAPEDIVVTATRNPQNAFSSARVVTICDKKEIAGKNQLSALDALDDKIGVWIEKRTTTTSDPVVRGLSGGNVLALVDGNGLSTFWGEGGFAGDDMYGKIDGESIQRIEVVRGPASVMYGSNALGGVINILTKKAPLDFPAIGYLAGGAIKGASGSASDYVMGRAEIWGASPHFKYFAGGTTHRVETMRAGGGIGYITPSGGKDWSFDVNAEAKINDKNFLELSGQYLNRPETYRSYRPTQKNSNERLGVNLGYKLTSHTVLTDVLRLNVYHQYKKDIRYWYTDKSLHTLKDEGFAWWKTYSADAHAAKHLSDRHTLLYGTGYHLDAAESPDDEQFAMKTPSGEQQASPGTRWHNASIYLHDEYDIVPFLTLSGGIRYDYFLLVSDSSVFFTKPGDPDANKNKAMTDPEEYSKNAITGGVAGIVHLGPKVNIAASWARGFRMYPPGFGFRQTGQGVLTPNGLLEPVTADLFEITPRLKTNALGMYISGYYTAFHNFQQPVHGNYNGDTVIDFNNNGAFEPDERVYVTVADGAAFVTGIEAEIDLSLGTFHGAFRGFHLVCGAMYNHGTMQYPGTQELPLRHTHPPRGVVKLRYDDPAPLKRGWFEFTADIAAKYDRIERSRLLSDVGYLENPQDPASGLYRSYGLPSYRVFDARGGIFLNKNISATFAVENIFDSRYRTAHSRMDASGRNVLVGFTVDVPSAPIGRR